MSDSIHESDILVLPIINKTNKIMCCKERIEIKKIKVKQLEYKKIGDFDVENLMLNEYEKDHASLVVSAPNKTSPVKLPDQLFDTTN